jgi:hypothetical protein
LVAANIEGQHLAVDRVRKILGIWAMIEIVYVLSLLVIPHESLGVASFLSYSLQTLLLIICVSIVKHEPAKKNKFIFLNFAAFFSLSVLAHLYNFVGPSIPSSLFYPDAKFAKYVLDQYLFRGIYFLLLSLAVVYLTVDLLFRDARVLLKYFVASIVVAGFFVYSYGPFLVDPLHSYHSPEVADFKALDRSYGCYAEANGHEPSIQVLANSVELYSWDQADKGRLLNAEEKLKRTEELFPYLAGSNYQVLVNRQLSLNMIYMSLVCVGFIFLFFGYQIIKDPPQGAYIEKIMFLLLVFCTLEIVHAWTFINSLNWGGFTEVFIVGQYVSVFVLLLMAVFFGLRLRFITSAKGEFYEQELAISPGSITRWRDTLDNMVIQKFFNPKVIIGRLLVDPSRR